MTDSVYITFILYTVLLLQNPENKFEAQNTCTQKQRHTFSGIVKYGVILFGTNQYQSKK